MPSVFEEAVARFGYLAILFESHRRMAARVPQLERLMKRHHTAWFFPVRYVWGLRWASAALAGSMRMDFPRRFVRVHRVGLCDGTQVFASSSVPPNDGGLALGQAAVAASRLTT